MRTSYKTLWRFDCRAVSYASNVMAVAARESRKIAVLHRPLGQKWVLGEALQSVFAGVARDGGHYMGFI